jgi:hypothetical protein
MKAGAIYERPDGRANKKMVATSKNYCLTERCRGLVHKKKEHSPFCAKCRTRRFAKKFPLKYSFNNLRKRAKERGHGFDLSFGEYESFALRSGYDTGKGKTPDSLSIDRIANDGPYKVGNIRVLTLSFNSMKAAKKSFVPFFANQIENQAYQPTAEEIEAIQKQLAEHEN